MTPSTRTRMTFYFICLIIMLSQSSNGTTLKLPDELIQHTLQFLSVCDQIQAAILSCKLFHKCWIKSNNIPLKDMEYLNTVFKTLDRQLLDMGTIPKLHSIQQTYLKKFETLYLFKLAQCMKVLSVKRNRLLGTRAIHRCNGRYVSELFIPNLVEHAELLISKYFNSTSYSSMDDDTSDSLMALHWIFVHFTHTFCCLKYSDHSDLERLAEQCKLVHMFDQMIHHNRLIFKHGKILNWFTKFYRKSKHVFKQESMVIFQARVAMSYLNYFLGDVPSAKMVLVIAHHLRNVVLELIKYQREDLLGPVLVTKDCFFRSNSMSKHRGKCIN